MNIPSDYDIEPDWYRLGMAIAGAHAAASLSVLVAETLVSLGARRMLDVGCADGVLRAAQPGPWLVGLDRAAPLLRAHPRPVVQADATRLPFRDESFDAVTALNVLYHLPDPLPALREAHRVLRPGGHLLVSAISRTDSPELAAYWARPATSFDAEDAPAVVAHVFGPVTVHAWDPAGHAARPGGGSGLPAWAAGVVRRCRAGRAGGSHAARGDEARRAGDRHARPSRGLITRSPHRRTRARSPCTPGQSRCAQVVAGAIVVIHPLLFGRDVDPRRESCPNRCVRTVSSSWTSTCASPC